MKNRLFRALSLVFVLVLLMPTAAFAAEKPKSIVISTEDGFSETLNIKVGEKIKLQVNPTPATASTGTITWKSSSKSVATIDKTGLVTAKKEGKVTISAKTKNGGKKDTITVRVTNPSIPKKLTLNYSGTVKVNVGSTLTVIPTLSPATASSAITWHSSDSKKAKVSKSGVVTPLREGKVTITAKTKVGKLSAKFKLSITDPKKPTKITLEKKGTVKLDKGETLTVNFALSPSTAISSVKWSSSNKKIATVSKTGLITAKKKGKAKITAKTSVGGKSASFTVQVSAKKYAAATPTPTIKPTPVPTIKPTAVPTVKPTAVPTIQPTAVPTVKPTAVPTVKPTAVPTVKPTAVPTPPPMPAGVPTSVSAPSVDFVPEGVGMNTTFTTATDSTIKFDLNIATTFGMGLTDYGALWEDSSGNVKQISARFGDVSGATYSITLRYLIPGEEYTVVGYAVQNGVTLRSAGFKVILPE